ncbi:unnamed protein product [Prorocentrum cordatum]|uniref:Uncharacterized protein n=1 Tax=Prorocentrum cordatum TaxID=2364126 RepID=A0ABN9TPM3_9DINO|nr:unnamed protein product [Polarella glacialis]
MVARHIAGALALYTDCVGPRGLSQRPFEAQVPARGGWGCLWRCGSRRSPSALVARNPLGTVVSAGKSHMKKVIDPGKKLVNVQVAAKGKKAYRDMLKDERRVRDQREQDETRAEAEQRRMNEEAKGLLQDEYERDFDIEREAELERQVKAEQQYVAQARFEAGQALINEEAAAKLGKRARLVQNLRGHPSARTAQRPGVALGAPEGTDRRLRLAVRTAQHPPASSRVPEGTDRWVETGIAKRDSAAIRQHSAGMEIDGPNVLVDLTDSQPAPPAFCKVKQITTISELYCQVQWQLSASSAMHHVYCDAFLHIKSPELAAFALARVMQDSAGFACQGFVAARASTARALSDTSDLTRSTGVELLGAVWAAIFSLQLPWGEQVYTICDGVAAVDKAFSRVRLVSDLDKMAATVLRDVQRARPVNVIQEPGHQDYPWNEAVDSISRLDYTLLQKSIHDCATSCYVMSDLDFAGRSPDHWPLVVTMAAAKHYVTPEPRMPMLDRQQLSDHVRQLKFQQALKALPVATWATDINDQVAEFNATINRCTSRLFAEYRFSARKPCIKSGTMAFIRLRRYVRRAQQSTFRHSLEPLLLLARLLPKQVQMFVYECRGQDGAFSCPWEGPLCQLAMACDFFQAEEFTMEELLAAAHLFMGATAGALRWCLRRDRQDFLTQTAKKTGAFSVLHDGHHEWVWLQRLLRFNGKQARRCDHTLLPQRFQQDGTPATSELEWSETLRHQFAQLEDGYECSEVGVRDEYNDLTLARTGGLVRDIAAIPPPSWLATRLRGHTAAVRPLRSAFIKHDAATKDKLKCIDALCSARLFFQAETWNQLSSTSLAKLNHSLVSGYRVATEKLHGAATQNHATYAEVLAISGQPPSGDWMRCKHLRTGPKPRRPFDMADLGGSQREFGQVLAVNCQQFSAAMHQRGLVSQPAACVASRSWDLLRPLLELLGEALLDAQPALRRGGSQPWPQDSELLALLAPPERYPEASLQEDAEADWALVEGSLLSCRWNGAEGANTYITDHKSYVICKVLHRIHAAATRAGASTNTDHMMTPYAATFIPAETNDSYDYLEAAAARPTVSYPDVACVKQAIDKAMSQATLRRPRLRCFDTEEAARKATRGTAGIPCGSRTLWATGLKASRDINFTKHLASDFAASQDSNFMTGAHTDNHFVDLQGSAVPASKNFNLADHIKDPKAGEEMEWLTPHAEPAGSVLGRSQAPPIAARVRSRLALRFLSSSLQQVRKISSDVVDSLTDCRGISSGPVTAAICAFFPVVPAFRFGDLYDAGITIYLLIVGAWFYLRLPVRALAPLFFADPAGAVVGKLCTRRGFNRNWYENKSVMGTLAVLLFAFLSLDVPSAAARACLAVVCALAEAFGGKTYDNLAISVPVLGSWAPRAPFARRRPPPSSSSGGAIKDDCAVEGGEDDEGDAAPPARTTPPARAASSTAPAARHRGRRRRQRRRRRRLLCWTSPCMGLVSGSGRSA